MSNPKSRPARLALVLLGAVAIVPTTAEAQNPAEERDWRLPYRKPETRIAAPQGDLFETFRRLESLYASAPEADRKLVSGVDAVDSEAWRATMKKVRSQDFQSGYLSLILRDSNVVDDRRTAFFMAFQAPLTDNVRAFIEHIPGEPVRALREAAYPRAVAWLRHHDRPNVQRDAEEQATADLRLHEMQKRPRIDLVPFLAVLDLEPAVDRAQGLWFLTQCAEIHPYYGKRAIELGYDRLSELADDEAEQVRQQLSLFVAAADPDRERADETVEKPEDVRTRLEAIRYDLFPPVRRISDGVVEIYPSADRDAIVTAGREWLRNGQGFGENVSGRDANGQVYYGLQLPAAPEPLDRLGLLEGGVLVGISGAPVRRRNDVVELVERYAREGASIYLEFVDGQGKRRALEFRLKRG